MKQLNWYQIFGNTHTIPDGRTVTPTDDIQIWLNCANIWDKTYTTLAEVLADTDTLLALITSNNAVDYMVRSTTWAVSEALVPTMTSDTTPSGVCSASSVYQTFSAYKAFDGDAGASNYWSANVGTNSWLQYQFVSAIMPYMVKVHGVYADGHLRIKNFTVQGSNDGVTFTDIKSFQTIDKSGEQTFEVGSINNYSYLRISIADNWSESYYIRLHEVQFYSASVTTSATAMSLIGANDYAAETLLSDATWNEAIQNSEYFESVDNVKVPTMTSNTTPSGIASAENALSGSEAYKAFDGTSNDAWNGTATGSSASGWIQYQFTSKLRVHKFTLNARTDGYGDNLPKNLTLQASNDGTFTNIGTFTTTQPSVSSLFQAFAVNNCADEYSYFRLQCNNIWSSGRISIAQLQFYGRIPGGVQTWLRAAGITDKLYTTLSEVLADSTTLTALMSSHSAVDYLVTAKGWADDICADSGAMTAIGNNNYAADTLLADETWNNAIYVSTYRESVMNVKVPTMTSNTTPSGEAFASSVYNNRSDLQPWKAFDNVSDSTWASGAGDAVGSYIGYRFTLEAKIQRITLAVRSLTAANEVRKFKVQGYDGETWSDLSDVFTVEKLTDDYVFANTNNYISYRAYITEATTGSNNVNTPTIQFYGRKDV